MNDCSPAVSQQASEINLWNGKGLLDRFLALMAQGAEDNQNFARQTHSLLQRSAEDAQKVKYLAEIGLLQAGQTGATLNQDNVNPSATAAGRAVDQAGGVAAAQVSANVADLASTLITALGEFQTQLVATVAALNSVLVTAAGGASTPSQTSSKPTA